MNVRAGKSTREGKLHICGEYPVKDILAITGLQGFAFDEFERSCSIGLPFGTQEHGIWHVLIIKAVREFIQMRHEEYLDALFH